MVGRTSLAAVAATAMLFAASGLAYADNDFPRCRYVADRGPRPERVGHRQARRGRLRSRRVQARRGHDEIVVAVDADPSRNRRAQDSAASASVARSRAPSIAPRSPPSATPSASSTAAPSSTPPAACRSPGPPSPGAGRDGHPACQQVHELRRHVPVRGGAQQGHQARHRQQHPVHRPDAADGVRRLRRRLTAGRRGDAALHRHRSDARRVHVQPSADPAHGGRGQYPGRADDGPRRRQHGVGGHVQGHRVGGRDPAAARRGLPAGLLHALPGPDREPRAARRNSRPTSRTWSRRSTCRT